jgi:M6 family metalloprotease-like protein
MTTITRRMFLKQKSKTLVLFLLTIFLINFTLIDAQGVSSLNATVHIAIDQIKVPYDTNYGYPFIDQNGRTQVPLRITLESFGAEVGYDENLRMAYAKYNNILVHVPIGQSYIYVDGEKVMNDTPSIIYNDRTYCPIRIILEAFDATVEWDNTNATVVVSRPVVTSLVAEGFNGDYKTPLLIPTLVIMVGYSDVPLSTTEDQWQSFFFAPSKSVADYYSTMSNGRMKLVPAKETSGITNNGVIKISIKDEHPNYTAKNPDYANITTQPLFEEILNNADAFIDFSQYDVNKNGYVEPRELAINLIIAGDEESFYRDKSSKAVSGVMVSEGLSTEVDKVKLHWYALSGEMYTQDYGRRTMSTIGVATHEFGHLLGLPDLYDIDSSTVGLSFHSLMASGSNNFNFDYDFGEYPSPMIAWSRMFAGLIESATVKSTGTYSLFANAPYYNILKIPTQDPKIYYLVENREISGYGIAWNLYMDYGGIAIWKIDEHAISDTLFDNVVMSRDNQRGITLIEASGSTDLLKEELDIYYTRYNHYFSYSYVNKWVAPEGIIFEILDPTTSTMRINITLPE